GERPLPARGATPTVKLQPWGGVTGRCVDEDGRPVVGVRLLLHYPDGGHFQAALEEFDFLPAPVLTDRDGRFRAEGLMPGRKVQLSRPATAKPPAWTARPGEVHGLGTLSVATALLRLTKYA